MENENNETVDKQEKEEDEKRKTLKEFTAFISEQYASLKKSIINDLSSGQNLSVLYSKYPKERFVNYLKNPQRFETEIRRLSTFIYQTSSHYRRLCDYVSDILCYNYKIIPTNLDINSIEDIDVEEYRETYYEVAKMADKFNFKRNIPKIMKIAVRDGVYYGLVFESKDSFYIQNFDSHYAKITSITGGSYVYKINLDYFNTRQSLLKSYGSEFVNAYNNYKNMKNLNVKDSTNYKWFEPSNGICIKIDETDLIHSLPLFLGILASVYDIEDYKMLQKAKKENDNYIALSMKMDVDDDGIPKMNPDVARMYYAQSSANLPDGIGLLMTPFEISQHQFADKANSQSTDVIDAENEFWYAAGVSPLIFGSAKATTSQSLTLSVKPDEQIAFDLLKQIEEYFNNKIKLKNYKYGFKIDFSNQSIFNSTEIVERNFKAATYGVAGAKLSYAQALGLTPSDVLGLSFLEDKVLNVGTELFTRPLISSNTLSNGQVEIDDEGGRPTNEEQGLPLTDKGEESQERGGE